MAQKIRPSEDVLRVIASPGATAMSDAYTIERSKDLIKTLR
jgi:hypothetical protein